MGNASIENASKGRAAPAAIDHDNIMDRIREEYRDFADDSLDDLDRLIAAARKGDETPEWIIEAIRHGCHNLKGMGSSFGYPLITLISHRMEDYFAGKSDLDDRLLNDAQFFVDRMREVMEGRFDGISESEVVRTLPAKSCFDVDDIVKQDVEVLLVMPRCTSTRIVELELQGCGFRVVTETEPFNAIETAVRTSPDLILAAAVMETLSGIDLACALQAMPISRDLPFMLLTSLDPEHAAFADLPHTVPLIRRGEKFSDDLALGLAILGIT
ncbi:MAG: Hpt domain-containing protein [Alphaproteobacteria bacterium]